MEIVGLSGYARSGKDEAAKALLSLGFRHIAFADKLREFAYVLNPAVMSDYGKHVPLQWIIDEYGWNGYKRTQWSESVRVLLQRLGTECGRRIVGENIWVDATFRSLNDGNYAITDVRFPNEVENIKAHGGRIFRISRPGVGPANSHYSEVALDDYDFDRVIVNDGSIEEFHKKVRNEVIESRA